MIQSTNISLKSTEFVTKDLGLLNQRSFGSNLVLGRRALERLDLLLIVVEALDLNGSQGMLWTAKKVGLDNHFPNHVEIWKYRCHNPLRKATRRGLLATSDSNALILLICCMSERLYPLLRQLISVSFFEVVKLFFHGNFQLDN